MTSALYFAQKKRIAAAVCIGLTMASASAVADDAGFALTLSAGAGLGPDYLGSNDYAVGFGGSLRASYGRYFIEASLESAKANISGVEGLELGPVVRERGGRSDVEDGVVDRLRDIDKTIEVGGFVRVDLGAVDVGLEVTHDVGGEHNGFIAELGARLPLPVSETITLTPSIGTAWISDDFADTYFSIDADNAARSGLDRFDADGGLGAISAGLAARFQLSDRIALNLLGRYARLLDDAASSPVTDDRGSADQAFLRSTISYRF
jgi:outer membrane protein